MDPATVAGIFAGTITNWNDPAIAATNEGVTLPDLAITPVHRADDSGTTENFTDYLYQAAPDVWTWEPDGVWPATPVAGEAAPQTSGVVAAVEGGTGTIGYADASRAEGFGQVAVQIGDEFVPFSPEAAAAVVDASPLEEGRTAGDLAIALDRTPDSAAYPIVLVELHDRVRGVRRHRDRAAGEGLPRVRHQPRGSGCRCRRSRQRPDLRRAAHRDAVGARPDRHGLSTPVPGPATSPGRVFRESTTEEKDP